MMFLLKMECVWWLFDHIWCMIECISEIIFEWWMSEGVNMFIDRWLWNNGCLSMKIEWWIDYVWVYKCMNGWWLLSDDYECICE